MSTYISQLMRQTGIAPPSPADSQNHDDLAAILQAETEPSWRGRESPIREEHHEVLIPLLKQPIEPIPPQSGVPPSSGERSPESTAVEQRNDPSGSASPRDNPLKVHPIHLDSLPFSGPLKLPSAFDHEFSAPFPSSQEQRISDVNALIAETVSNTTAQVSSKRFVPEQKSLQPAPSSTVPAQPLSEQTSESERSISLDPSILEVNVALPVEQVLPLADLSSRAHTDLQDIRDWVAGSPTRAAIQEVFVNQSDSGSQPPLGRPYLSPAARTTLDNPYPAEASPAPSVQQDFVLSIGSIHLTITAPPPEMPIPLEVTPPADVTPDAELFRLSRHYLRFR